MVSFSEGAAAIDELAATYEFDKRNEATTRLHLIDTLLFEVLGWDRSECIAEDALDGQYTDYSLGKPVKRVVVEAKREGLHFELPIGPGALITTLQSVMRGNPAFESAVKQVVSYCATRGVQVAVVCNGPQAVAFLGSRGDGVPPTAGRCLVLRNFESMRDNFVQVWNCLSPSGIAESSLVRLLTVQATPSPPDKLSSIVFNYPGLRRRNEIDIEIDILGELFIEDVVRAKEIEDEFLRNCYCTSGALSQYALISKEILRTRYYESVERKYDDVAPAAEKKYCVQRTYRRDARARFESTPDRFTR